MNKKNISIDDLFKLKRIFSTKILPNKNFLFEEQAMNEEENKYNSAIYLISEDKDPKQFTGGLTQDKSMKLSYDKKKLAFLSTRGSDNSKPQIFIMDVDGGEAIKYSKAQNGVTNFNWSLDDAKMVYTHRVNQEEQKKEDEKNNEKKKTELKAKLEKVAREEVEKKKIDPRVIKKITYRQGTSYIDDKYSHIYVLDLETKEAIRITQGEENYSSPVLSEDNSSVYAVKQYVEGQLNDTFEYQIVEINIETKDEKIIRKLHGWGSSLHISPNGHWLAFSGYYSPEIITAQNNEIRIFNTKSGEERCISETIDNHANQPVFDSESNYLYFIVDNWETSSIHRYSLERETIEEICSGDYITYSFDVDSDQGLILFDITDRNEFSTLMLYDFVYKDLKTLWKVNKQMLDERELAQTEEIKYPGHEGQEIQGWIVKPPNFDEKKKYPAIVEIHGGPHATWSPNERSMWFEYQYFAAKGYVIFYCNPRGSSGRGYDFRNIFQQWGVEPANDILLGLDQVIEKGYIDKENLFITGGSYGGYMTAWIIGHDHRFKAAAPQRGVYNLISFWSTSDATRLMKDELGFYPWENLENNWEFSPLAYAHKTKTPTRIIHSENDFRVSISQAEEYFSTLLKAGVTAELIRYPEEGHELSRSGKPLHMKDRLEKIVGWFDNYKT
jgi:dipeptidyl aminopeptidase/acylaminoacyl peptidase